MTDIIIELAALKAKEFNIKHVVIASNTGETIKKAVGKFDNIAWITHAFGFSKPNEFEYSQETKEELLQKGVKILTTSHILSGAERGLSNRFQGYGPVEIMAHTLRMFGQGTKVAVEVAVMALDAGLIPENEQIISIGGSGRGADTALILTPAHASKILDTKIHQTIIKPQ